MLNRIFSAFDVLAEKHGLEKIKTIGDSYMVVGGLPMVRPDHAEAIAEMALDMISEIVRFNAEFNEAFNIRIGINTGPVVAGVIGIKKFIYDLWGDAVNTASRMESHGVPGRIQVTEATYKRLQNQYVFEERGVISVKGKGEMMTYFLRGRRNNEG
jgi:class 3 adenylate cyclase